MMGDDATQGPAATGQLVFLCGGDRDLFDTVSEDLDLMGKVSKSALSVCVRACAAMIGKSQQGR